MEEEDDDLAVNPDLIKEAIAALQINVPVGAARMVGRRLELKLYGGRVIMYPKLVVAPHGRDDFLPPPHVADMPISQLKLKHPEMQTRNELRELAASLGIKGAKSMNKIPLVIAIKKWKKDNNWIPLEERPA